MILSRQLDCVGITVQIGREKAIWHHEKEEPIWVTTPLTLGASVGPAIVAWIAIIMANKTIHEEFTLTRPPFFQLPISFETTRPNG